MWIQIQRALNESTSRVVTEIASLVPGIAALIVALLLSIFLAVIVTFLLRRSLRRIHFDERLTAWGFQSLIEWSPSNAPTLLVTRTIFWLIVLIGFLIGISAFNQTLTSQFVQRLFAYLPNVFAALILFFAGNFAARFLPRSVLIGGRQYEPSICAHIERWCQMDGPCSNSSDGLGPPFDRGADCLSGIRHSVWWNCVCFGSCGGPWVKGSDQPFARA